MPRSKEILRHKLQNGTESGFISQDLFRSQIPVSPLNRMTKFVTP